MSKGMLRTSRTDKLIQAYRGTVRADPEGHERIRAIQGLSEIVGSPKLEIIEEWVSQYETRYGLNSSGDEKQNIKDALARTTNPDDKAFLERLLRYNTEPPQSTSEYPSH